MRRHVDLFSGIGGFALAASWAGYETVQFVELDTFCQSVLRKHWPGVAIHDDIQTYDGRGLAGTVDLVTGGFPCQPYSVAGHRRGDEDDRAVWPEMVRVISEIRPTWVLGENVTGFITLGIDGAISDLEALGYQVQAFVIPACAVNAPHQRSRVWIVARLDDERQRDGRDHARGRRVNPVQSVGSGAGPVAYADRESEPGQSVDERRSLRGPVVADAERESSRERYGPDQVRRRSDQAEQTGVGVSRSATDAAGGGCGPGIGRVQAGESDADRNMARPDANADRQRGRTADLLAATESGGNPRPELASGVQRIAGPVADAACQHDEWRGPVAEQTGRCESTDGRGPATDDADSGRCEPSYQALRARWDRPIDPNRHAVAANVRRGNDGLSRRMDRNRLRALGNAIVPQVAYEIIGLMETADQVFSERG